MSKIRIKSVCLKWAEGPIAITRELEGKTFPALALADASLRLLQSCAPKGGGYYKVGFVITWIDGLTHEGRYDVSHDDVLPSIGRHVADFARFAAGLQRPAHLSKERYAAILERGDAQEWRKLLDNYDLEGAA
jgi:hypothetical protein